MTIRNNNSVERINSSAPYPAVRICWECERQAGLGLHGTKHRPLKDCWRVLLASTQLNENSREEY